MFTDFNSLKGAGNLLSPEYDSTSSCHGISVLTANMSYLMNISCKAEEEIAVKGSTVSLQSIEAGCNYDTILEKFDECCRVDDACVFDKSFKEDVLYTEPLSELCNGRQICLMQPPQIV